MFYTLVVCGGEGGDENERTRLSFLWQVFNDTVGGVAFKCGISVKKRTLLSADGEGLS